MNDVSVIVLCGQKGGTGKTTTAVSLAHEAQHRLRQTLVVDLDPQASARTWVGLGARAGEAVPSVVSMGVDLNAPGQLDRVAIGYEVIILDCPSRIEDRSGALMRAALLYAGQRSGLALLPCGPAAMDVWALADSIAAVRDCQTLCPALRAAVVLTRRSPARTILGESARATLADTGLHVLASELRHRMAYQEAPASGLGVAQYAPRTPAASEVASLYAEILGDAAAEVDA